MFWSVWGFEGVGRGEGLNWPAFWYQSDWFLL